MNSNIFKRYEALNIDTSLIGLEKTKGESYFCVPKGAVIFAGLGVDGVQFCFIEGFKDMVFIISPEAINEKFINPVSNNFEEFLGLILACKNANPIEQIYWTRRSNFLKFLADDIKYVTQEQEEVLQLIERELGIKPISNPYDFVKKIQEEFDYGKIQYSDEYYDVLGCERF